MTFKQSLRIGVVVLAVMLGTVVCLRVYLSPKSSTTKDCVVLVRPVCALNNARCAVLGSTYRSGQPFPMYDKLWLVSDHNHRLLSGVVSNSSVWVNVIDPIWNDSGDKLVWVKETTTNGMLLAIYDARTQRVSSQPIPSSMLATLFGSTAVTGDAGSWPTDKTLNLELLGWHPSGKYVMVSARLSNASHNWSHVKVASTLWQVGVEQEFARKVIAFKDNPYARHNLAWYDGRLLFTENRCIYELNAGKDAIKRSLNISDVEFMASDGKGLVFIIQRIGQRYLLSRVDLNNKRKIVLLDSDKELSQVQIGADCMAMVRSYSSQNGYALIALPYTGKAVEIFQTSKPFSYSVSNNGNKHSVVWVVGYDSKKARCFVMDGVNITRRRWVSVAK